MKTNSQKKGKNICADKNSFDCSDSFYNYPINEPSNTQKIAICIFLVLSILTVYFQIYDHEFLNFDDRGYITDNLNVQAGLTTDSIKWAFTTSHFSNWHPITWVSHMFDYQLYGLNPKGHLFTNLFFHIVNSILLFFVFIRMTGALWQSGFIAVMFAIHPFNVESVAWVAERKNLLSTLFFLLTILAYISYINKPGIKKYSFIILIFVLGLMSKPMLVTLPFVLLLIDFWPLRRLYFWNHNSELKFKEETISGTIRFVRLVYEKIPLFLLAAGSSIVTFFVQKRGGMMESMEHISLVSRITNAMVSYINYLGKTIYPKGLNIFYPHPENSLVVWKGMLCALILLGISTISIRCLKKAPYFAFGWFWYLGTLIPVIGIIQVGSQSMADRYAYIPLIGIFIVFGWGLPILAKNWAYKEKILSFATGVVIISLMIATWKQVGYWKNSTTVFKHSIKVNNKKYPNLAIAHNNLGIALAAEQKFKDAIYHYKMAIKLNPNLLKGQIYQTAMAHFNLGNALHAQENTSKAISHYIIAIKLRSNFFEAYINYGNALFAEQMIEEAITQYKTAIKINPSYAPSFCIVWVNFYCFLILVYSLYNLPFLHKSESNVIISWRIARVDF